LSLDDLDALFSDILGELHLPVDVVALSLFTCKPRVEVLVLEDPVIVSPLSEVGLLFDVVDNEVAHEVHSLNERFVTAHEAEVKAVVAWEVVGRVCAVDGLMFVEPSSLKESFTLGALDIWVALIFTLTTNGHGELSTWIFCHFTFQAGSKNYL
jgi:hypothetical protein